MGGGCFAIQGGDNAMVWVGIQEEPAAKSCAHRSRAGFNASAYQAAIKRLDDPDKRGKNGDYNALQWGEREMSLRGSEGGNSVSAKEFKDLYRFLHLHHSCHTTKLKP